MWRSCDARGSLFIVYHSRFHSSLILLNRSTTANISTWCVEIRKEKDSGKQEFDVHASDQHSVMVRLKKSSSILNFVFSTYIESKNFAEMLESF